VSRSCCSSNLWESCFSHGTNLTHHGLGTALRFLGGPHAHESLGPDEDGLDDLQRCVFDIYMLFYK
jgi:hypothetical protein